MSINNKIVKDEISRKWRNAYALTRQSEGPRRLGAQSLEAPKGQLGAS